MSGVCCMVKRSIFRGGGICLFFCFKWVWMASDFSVKSGQEWETLFREMWLIPKKDWCFYMLLVWKSVRAALISIAFHASGLHMIQHLEMWLIVAYSVPGGVVTAKQSKIQKRKRCIFIMGTVSKLWKIKRKQNRGDFMLFLFIFRQWDVITDRNILFKTM